MLPMKTLENIISQLENIANYEGVWEGLCLVAKNLKYRIEELKKRSKEIDSLLIVAIVGGTGVGKSTLINAIAGDKIAKMSPRRPCTERPTIYHPPTWEPDRQFVESCVLFPRSALDNIVLIDTPDTDSIVTEHRDFTKKMIEKSDLILICGEREKYLDEKTWSFVREVKKERSFVLIETKVESSTPSIMNDWVEKLKKEDIIPLDTFRVNALRSLDRKLGISLEEKKNEFDFPKLEEFLQKQLTEQKIRQIKTSNIRGLLEKTINYVDVFLKETEPEVYELKKFIEKKKEELISKNERLIRNELNRETGVLYSLLKDKISPNLHGIFSLFVQVQNLLWNFLYRISKIVHPVKFIKEMITSPTEEKEIDTFADSINQIVKRMMDPISKNIDNELYKVQSEFMFTIEKSQIRKDVIQPISNNFKLDFYKNAVKYLESVIDFHIARKARCLSNYFFIELFYLPMYALIVYIFWKIVPGYFMGVYLEENFFIHSLVMFLFSIWPSFWLYDKMIYFSARRLRVKITRQFVSNLRDIINPFREMEKPLEEIEKQISAIQKIRSEIQSLN